MNTTSYYGWYDTITNSYEPYGSMHTTARVVYELVQSYG